MNTATKSPANTAKKTAGKTASTAAPEATTTAPAPRAPSHEDIAVRAYALFTQRNGAGGSPLDDWFRAERELTA